MREIDVVRQVRTFLLQAGLANHRVVDLYTDAHPTLREDASLQPFQRFALLLDGFTVHPDLVGRLSDGETTFAVEAKGEDDLLRGLAQAASYRFGFHRVFLASAGAPPADLITLARQQHVGILAAFPDQVQVLDLPPAHMPRYSLATAVRQQFLTTSALQTTFSFNVPTHYLSIAVALRDNSTIALPALEARVRVAYPVLPRGTVSFLSVLRGAQKLGIVRVRSDLAEPTMVGAAAGHLLPDLTTLAAIHRVIARPPRSATLVSESPQSGAVLRWLLTADSVVALIVATLTAVGGGPLPMPELARRALERDKVQALTIFFNPELISEITDVRSNVIWSQVRPHHFRSNTFFQYKSILKHAGILVPHRLGGASAVDYRPDTDLWELADSSLVQGEARTDGPANN
jgi:hypothetical protein